MENPFESFNELLKKVDVQLDKLSEKLDRIYENLIYQVNVADLNCVTYNEVRKITQFGQTKIDQMVCDGELTRINVSGHPRFNIKQLAVDLGIPLAELNRILNGNKKGDKK